MTFKWFRLLPIVAMSIFPALSQAQSLCDPGGMEQEMELRRALPASCQKERVQASGRVSFNIINSAEKIANEAWRRERNQVRRALLRSQVHGLQKGAVRARLHLRDASLHDLRLPLRR